jgi:uncharacterized protein DUF6011
MLAITVGDRREGRCLAPWCGRKLTARKSVDRGYGDVCYRRICEAAEREILAGVKPEQAAKVRQLIADGGIIPARRPGVYQAVAEDGERLRLTHSHGCNCESGLRRRPVTCYHTLAARVLELIRTRSAATVPDRTPIAPPYAAALPAAA